MYVNELWMYISYIYRHMIYYFQASMTIISTYEAGSLTTYPTFWDVSLRMIVVSTTWHRFNSSPNWYTCIIPLILNIYCQLGGVTCYLRPFLGNFRVHSMEDRCWSLLLSRSSCGPSWFHTWKISNFKRSQQAMILLTYPWEDTPNFPKTAQRKEILHKLLVKRPGYLPGVCGWDLRFMVLLMAEILHQLGCIRPWK